MTHTGRCVCVYARQHPFAESPAIVNLLEENPFQNNIYRASLVVQWLRIRLPMQGTQVRALVWEDPTCRGATKLMRHNY